MDNPSERKDSMKKKGKVEEVEVKVLILKDNIKALKQKMTDKEKKRKYEYHLRGLERAKAKLLAMAQLPMNKNIPLK